MPELDILAAKKRCEAAMPEPWTLRREDDGAPNVDVMSGETVIATMGDFFPEAEFVAHARSDVPALVEALEEAQEHVARLETVVELLDGVLEEGIVALEALPPRPGLWRLKKIVAILKGESE